MFEIEGDLVTVKVQTQRPGVIFHNASDQPFFEDRADMHQETGQIRHPHIESVGRNGPAENIAQGGIDRVAFPKIET